jgi:predicted  nucleic acid-binding Zn-ribbon protein
MHPDLERLINLQALELELQSLRRTIANEAERRQAIQDAVDARRAALADIRQRLAANQHARREIEKDLAQVQTRLSRYKDQLMAVKTNKEYHAMQTEISAAEAEVRKFEDRILDSMVEADDINAALKAAERETSQAESDAAAAIQALGSETRAASERLGVTTDRRDALARELPADLLATFENIAQHRGTAVVEARDGHCSYCHVRLRPLVFQQLRRNESVMRCDSCQRILYYKPPAAPAPAGQ